MRNVFDALFQRSKPNPPAIPALFPEELLKPLNSIVGFDQLVNLLCAKLHEQLHASTFTIVVFEPVTNRYVGKKSSGMHADLLREMSFLPGDNLIRWLGVNKMPLDTERDHEVVRYLSEHERALLERTASVLIVPLIVVNRLTGIFFVGRKTDQTAYHAGEVASLILAANQSALAIEHALMYQFQEDKLKKLFQADSLATVGELAAGAAHEIRNPLTSIRSTVQYLQKDLPEEKKVLVQGIIEEVDRIDQIIKGLLSFSRSSELHMTGVDIGALLQQTLLLLEPEFRKHSITVRKEADLSCREITGDPSQLKQVFLNILLNSIQAMPKGGTVTISVGEADKTSGMLTLSMTDTGSGIPEESLGRVFDPFYTTKESGTGLGLSLSYGIINKHGGEIELESRTAPPQQGTTVLIRLPVRRPAGGEEHQ